MPMTGLHLAQYRIDAELGRGGMGIVYRATDTKLDRTVALKVLPASALSSDDDRARFYREAKAAAQLHHPNIASVFQIDEAVPHREGREPQEGAEARPFIAMEFVDGETLAARIAKAPLRLTEAVSIATQVAEALKAAHAKDIVHRDIKSANVMLTEGGVAKVLDFGLAKTAASTQLTRQGSTLGTVAYMSPEQAKGQDVDSRTDLYSLGTVLYEMVSGRLPFGGDYEQAILYGILNEDPEPLTALRTGVPMELERIAKKLLSKQAEYRYQTAADLIADLKSLDVSGSGTTRRSMPTAPGTTAPPSGRGVLPKWVYGAIAGGLVLGAAGVWMLGSGRGMPATSLPSVRSEIFPEGGRVPQALALSPDGSQLAYSDAADGRVWIRDLESGEERDLPNTSDVIELDYSPDGTWLLLDQVNSVQRVPVAGGSPVTLVTTVSRAPHSSWVDDETILFDDLASIHELSLANGELRILASADSTNGELRLIYGRISPDRKTLLALIVRDPIESLVGVYSYPGGEPITKAPIGDVTFRLAGSGHLLTVNHSVLSARPFNPGSSEVAGAEVLLADHVSETGWDLSANGLLAWAPVTSFQFLSSARIAPEVRLAAGGGADSTEFLPVPVDHYGRFRISPDGSRMAVEKWLPSDAGADVWVLDLSSGIQEQLTFGSSGRGPTWSPDGDSLLAVITATDGVSRLEVFAADGSGAARTVYTDSLDLVSPDWSDDGNLIAMARGNVFGSSEILFVDPAAGTARAGLELAYELNDPVFSPDGRYLAFSREERIFVRPTDSGGGEWDVSQGPGNMPQWAPDGSAVYFVNGGRIMRMPVDARGRFRRLAVAAEIVVQNGVQSLYYSPHPQTGELIYVQSPNYGIDTGPVVIHLLSNALGAIGRLAPVDR